MRLTGIRRIRGILELKTGLYIGAGDMEMHIGGVDRQVVKNPRTGIPYIPGSSLKGKVRSLLELKSGLMAKTKGKVIGFSTLKDLNGKEKEEALKIVKVFGAGGERESEDDTLTIGPTRASFSDAVVEPDWLKGTMEKNHPILEVKFENSINRIKGTAENPRQTERVIEGTPFSFLITFKQFEGDAAGDKNELLEYLLDGLKLLENDHLGGSGSRGYGRVQFTRIEADGTDITEEFRNRNLDKDA